MKTIGAVLIVLLLVGCKQEPETNQSDSNSRIQGLEKEVDALKKGQEVSSNDFRSEFAWVYTNLDNRIQNLEATHQNWVAIDPTTSGYQKIDTSLFPMLVKVTDVLPFLDGYKIKLEIGNPYTLQFNGFHIFYKWGLPFKSSNGRITNLDEVLSSQKSGSDDRPEVLQSGYWNTIELTISPATSEEIKTLRIAIEPNTIALSDQSQGQQQ